MECSRAKDMNFDHDYGPVGNLLGSNPEPIHLNAKTGNFCR